MRRCFVRIECDANFVVPASIGICVRHTGNTLDAREHHFSDEIAVAGHLPHVAGFWCDGKPRDGRPELIPTRVNPWFSDIIRITRYLVEPIHDFDQGTLQVGLDGK